MANVRGNNVDKTFLSIDTAEERQLIHRDYIGHCNRWSHAARCLGRSQRYKSAKVLDIGCGVEVPMGKMLYSNRFVPEAYCGIDVRDNLEWPEMLKKGIDSGKLQNWSLVSGDCATVTPDQLGFNPNFITCFEIVEHVEADHRVHILQNMLSISDAGVHMLLSTPNYSHSTGPADNHVDETTHACLGAMIEDCGWRILDMFGTFASIKDYKDKILEKYGDSGVEIFARLRDYYDTNMLATIFAPLFPEESRNIMWHLVRFNPADSECPPRRYPSLRDLIDQTVEAAEAATIQVAESEPDATEERLKEIKSACFSNVFGIRIGHSEKWLDPEFREAVLSSL